MSFIGSQGNKEEHIDRQQLHADPNLLPPGGYIDPNYRMLSNASLEKIWDGVLEHLESEHIDHEEPDSIKKKVVCVSYYNASRVPFFVRIFQLDTKLVTKYGNFKFAVEFQRRSVALPSLFPRFDSHSHSDIT